MRILKLRFKNLNSLVGEWTIDFTLPEYTSDGIFAITGRTGAGKTTIFDAICLALYGRTPRLAKIVKTNNEIMSRQTGECFSEIIFETQSGRYRCFWGQHRSRKSSSGDLQTQRHEIVDDITDLIIEEKLRLVADKIEQETGMDFDRFTRSMLLAQGEFSAFLQASADDRAPILEQITGTEIYSEISVNVHKRHVQERVLIDGLKAELAAISLMSVDDVQIAKNKLVEGKDKERGLAQEIKKHADALIWMDDLLQLETSVMTLSKQRQYHHAIQSEVKPQQAVLELANRVLELSADYATLTALREEQKNTRIKLVDCQEQCPSQESKVVDTERLFVTSQTLLLATKKEEKDKLKTIKTVRELDVRLSQKKNDLGEMKAQITVLANKLKTDVLIHKTNEEKLEQCSKKQDALMTHSRMTLIDEGLIDAFSGLEQRLLSCQDVIDNRVEYKTSISASQKETDRQVIEYERVQLIWKNASETALRIDTEYQTSKKQMSLLLEGQMLSEWRKNRNDLEQRRLVFLDLFRAMDTKKSSQLVYEKADLSTLSLAKDEPILVNEISALKSSEKNDDGEIKWLEEKITLLNKVKSLEDERLQLREGVPCSLCGSKNHPYASDNVPMADESIKALNVVRTKKVENSRLLMRVNERYIKLKSAQENLQLKMDECTEVINAEADKIKIAMSLLGLKESAYDVLDALKNEENNALLKIVNIIEKVESKEIQSAKSKSELDRVTLRSQQLADDVTNEKHAADLLKKSVEKFEELNVEANEKLQKMKAGLLNELTPYQLTSSGNDDNDGITDMGVIATLRTTLADRRNKRMNLNSQIQVLGEEEVTFRTNAEVQTASLVEQKQRLETQQQVEQRINEDYGALSKSRYALFFDKNPDEEERRLAEAINVAENQAALLQSTLAGDKEILAQLKSRLGQLVSDVESRGDKLTNQENRCHKKWVDLGFSDEKTYLAARLPESEREQLSAKLKKIDAEGVRLETLFQEKTSQLKKKKEINLTSQSRDSLAKLHETFKTDLALCQQSLWSSQERLKENDTLLGQQKTRIAKLEKQQSVFDQWDVLHQLIGSADGKKFRNFAQGVTFEMMVNHANRQLVKMTDRYLLVRDESSPLTLNVLDNYHAGEARSTKNLSGGEGFIVSLALALGLSQMASKKVRVDSLFLDEGFGTLDEDALDIALDTLGGLQQEGKLIGVISHVLALKSRIGTQIQVNTVTGGRSEMRGPGCERIS